MTTRVSTLLFAVLSTMLPLQYAFAADGAAPNSTDSVETVVVTAEKRVVSDREVPGGVAVVDDQALNDARIKNVEDMTKLVPGLEVGDSSGGQLTYPAIRGVAPQVFGDPTVSIFQDGFSFANSLKASSEEIFDADRVEVLKGPQATLYGANSLGGVVNVISKLPSLDTYEGDFRASYGEYDSAVLKGAVSIPVIDDELAIRVGGYWDSRDGYWKNLYNGNSGQDATSNKGARGAIRFVPTNNFESDLVYSYTHTHSDCSDCSNPIVGYDPLDPTAIGEHHINVNHLADYTDENYPGFYNRQISQVTLKNALTLGDATITSLTGYGSLQFSSDTDTDRTPGNTSIFTDLLVLENQSVFSEELRAASNGSGPLQWQIGAYYSNSLDHAYLNAGIGLPSRLPVTNNRERFDSFAIFTQNSYQISSNFRIEFGLRYDHETKGDTNVFTSQLVKTGSNAWLPKLSAIYSLGDDNNLYATISRGYKTGGTNAVIAGNPPTYAPEYLWNYEVGLKGVNSNRDLSYDIDAYYIDWTDQQVEQTNGIFEYITNAATTSIYGAEAALHYSPISDLTLDLTLAYNHARYQKYFDFTGLPTYFGASPDRSGQPTFLSPDWSGALSGHYTYPIGNGYDVTLYGDVRYTGERSLDSEGILKGDPYALADLSLSIGDDNKRLTLFANNVFNARYATAAFLFVGIPPVTHLGAPRVAGVQVDLHF